MRLYLQGSTEPTIPHSFAQNKELYFEHGCADRAGRRNVGTGSRLFEPNVHLWQFGRQQPRIMSVSERLQRKQDRQRVSAARKQHKRTGRRRVTQVQNGQERLREAVPVVPAEGGNCLLFLLEGQNCLTMSPKNHRGEVALPEVDGLILNCAVDLPCNHAHGQGNSVHLHT